MKKRRMIRCAALLLAYLLAWGICAAITASVTASHQTKHLQSQADLYWAGLNRVMEETADTTLRLFAEQGGRSDGSLPDLFHVMERLSLAEAAADYLIMDPAGELHQSGGPVGKALGSDVMENARQHGYGAAYIERWKDNTDNFAIVSPPIADGDYYLVRIEPLTEFSRRAVEQLGAFPAGKALFNQWGVLVRQSEGFSPEATRSLEEGAKGFADGSESGVLPSGKAGIRNMYIPLDQPEGWFVGLQISLGDVFPEFRILYIAMIFAFAAGLILLAISEFGELKNAGVGALQGTNNADPLTGLMGTSQLEDSMRRFFRKEAYKDYSLIAMDINSFRRFNTMYGSEKGDALLRAVGSCLQSKYHCGTRINGDIFAFVAPSSIGVIRDIERELNGAIKEELGPQYLQLISYKFGVYPLLAEEFHYREAYDGMLLALKNAKSTPKLNRIIYDRAMQRTTKMNKDIEMNMQKGLQQKEFLLYIQPKFNAQTLRCCGGEALVRWQSEEMGFLTPFHFVPLFETNGFIAELDFYMLRCMLDTMQRLIDQGKKPLPISVNMSRITISFPNYLERLVELVREYSVPLKSIEIEITESAVTENFESVASLIGQLRELGFTVAMDDFGTGYSSLNTLRELPVDILKLDKEFLLESDTSLKGRKIIQSVLNMAGDLSIGTVCEGVETGSQLDFLQKAGCDMLQGYLLSKPILYSDFEKRYIE